MTGAPWIFGEVLFDHFPGGRRVLGGAPFNVAWHLAAFGAGPRLISRVGEDAEGVEVRRAMRDWGLDVTGLQVDPELPTGRVEVSIEGGEPSYDIVHPAAWDAIAARPQSTPCSLFYHGSLALRDERSRESWRLLRNHQRGLVFVDVNLRPPWWRPEQVLGLVAGADWVKLNRAELAALCGGENAAPEDAAAFRQRHGLRGLVLTDGARGAQVLTADAGCHAVQPAGQATVVDTVGAGDALASVIILGLLAGWPIGIALQRAQSFATAMVGQRGATVRDRGFYRAFLRNWGLADDRPVSSTTD